VSSEDPGPIVEAKEAKLDQPLPVAMCNALGFCLSHPLVASVDLNAVWAWSEHDAWVFGDGGTALRWDGRRFRSTDTGTYDDFVAVWANAPNDLFVLGRHGTLLHYDGRNFRLLWRGLESAASGTARRGTRPIDALEPRKLAKHPATRARFDVELTNPDGDPSSPVFYDMWGTKEGKLWVAGDIELAPAYMYNPRTAAGLLRHFDGAAWSSQVWRDSGPRVAVWGRSQNEVFLWSAQDHVVQLAGTGWRTPSPVPSPKDFEELHARGLLPGFAVVWQQRPTDAWIVRRGDEEDLVERVNLLKGEPRSASRLARLTFPKGSVNDIRGSASDSVWLVGERGLLLRFDGERWRGYVPPRAAKRSLLRAVWAVTPDDVWAVGQEVLRFDGKVWREAPRPPGTGELTSVWGERSDAVWIVGANGAFFFDGTNYTRLETPPEYKLQRVLGSGSTVWIITDRGVLHGTREGLTVFETPEHFTWASSLVVQSEAESLFIGKQAHRWNGQTFARNLALEALVASNKLGTFMGDPGNPGTLFAHAPGELVRIQDDVITDRVPLETLGLGRWLASDGAFWVTTNSGVVSYEEGQFHFATMPTRVHASHLAGDAENVWLVAFDGSIWRKHRSRGGLRQ
jgi:hypothetical protein